MTQWHEGIPDSTGFDRYGDSPYYDDNLKVVAELSDDEPWEFNMVVVWQKDDELRAAWDAGCSCPTPFADLTWDTMKPIRSVSDLDSLIEQQGTIGAEVVTFKTKVAVLLRD